MVNQNLVVIILVALIASGVIFYFIQQNPNDYLDLNRLSCKSSDDCLTTTYLVNSCCPVCELFPVNSEEYKLQKEWRKNNCDYSKRPCPEIKCSLPNKPALCVENKCVLKSLVDDKNCDEMEKEIKNLIEEVNYCENDSDCAVGGGYYCPFGCYQLYNKDADLKEIDDKVKMFRENKCNFCEYECMAPPETKDIRCVNNKCVDIRYSN